MNNVVFLSSCEVCLTKCYILKCSVWIRTVTFQQEGLHGVNVSFVLLHRRGCWVRVGRTQEVEMCLDYAAYQVRLCFYVFLVSCKKDMRTSILHLVNEWISQASVTNVCSWTWQPVRHNKHMKSLNNITLCTINFIQQLLLLKYQHSITLGRKQLLRLLFSVVWNVHIELVATPGPGMSQQVLFIEMLKHLLLKS